MCQLIAKYNKPAPRYTSYPTVPYWDQELFLKEAYIQRLQRTHHLQGSEGIALYVHLPFCESLCTFCGCHKRITKRHEVEEPYLSAVIQEMALYHTALGQKPLVREIHLGGGTPTFFSPENLQLLMHGLFEHIRLAEGCEMSFEGHPGNTTKTHLQALFDCGFRRVCFGVQDYNTTVQKAIHRIQTVEQVAQVTQWAREVGYTSVGHDLIYGLPFQNEEHIRYTLEQTKTIQPDRISWYSYAHVPWMKGNGQRGFDESNLPTPKEKDQQKQLGTAQLLEWGYHEVGMDHFALPSDTLYQAAQSGKLHRNFMGYTAQKTPIMIGLGASSIGDCGTAFGQNEKNIESYQELVFSGQFPVQKGHLMTQEDLIIRSAIEELMCQFSFEWVSPLEALEEFDEMVGIWLDMQNDGLLELDNNRLRVTEKGRPFVRNIASAMDVRLLRRQPQKRTFSMSV